MAATDRVAMSSRGFQTPDVPISRRVEPAWRPTVGAVRHAATSTQTTACGSGVEMQVEWFRAYVRSLLHEAWDGQVVVETAVDADQVTAETLVRACGGVDSLADDLGELVAAMFDGATPFPAQRGA